MKKILAVILVVAMAFGLPAASAIEGIESQDISIKEQIDNLIMAVDQDALKRDAMENVVDYSVPLSVRESITCGADIISDSASYNSASYEDQFTVEVNSTVQKVGEINYSTGEKATVYVAVAAADTKAESGFNTNLGAIAWTYLWWIDNFGPKNELYAVKAEWDTTDCSYDIGGKVVQWGTCVPNAPIFLSSDTRVLSSTVKSFEHHCGSEGITGLSFACMSEMAVGPSPIKLTCWVYSHFDT